jgi:hypothetical protein
MNNTTAGSILLVSAGLVAAIGVLGAQIANALVLGAFYIGHITGEVPPTPQAAGLNWVIIAAAAAQAFLGFYLLFSAPKSSSLK